MASQLIRDLAISVKREALLFLPNPKSLIRADNLGIIDNLIEAAQGVDLHLHYTLRNPLITSC
jgi:hypothetical protein